MIKHIMVALVLVCLLSELSGASSKDNSGNLTYPNVAWSSVIATGYYYGDSYYTGDNTIKMIGYRTGGTAEPRVDWADPPQGKGWSAYPDSTATILNASQYATNFIRVHCNYGHPSNPAYVTVFYMPITINTNTISGDIDCLDWTYLQAKNSTGSYVTILKDTTDSYSFDIINGTDYRLMFSDNHLYYFSCNGSDIIYNYDDCTHTQYRFEESCGNLIPDSEGYYCENWIGDGGICYPFHESDGILDISNTSAASIEVYTNTFIGQTGWIIDPVISNTTYVLQNPTINWGLKVIVQNESDGTLIDDAMVKVDQDCYCTSGYSTRQKMSVNGMAQFGDMSLQDASLFVMKYGYKICDENSTGYSAFLSGRSNFSSKTWLVKLAPSTSNNSSTFYEVNNKVDIHFRDVDGNRTSKILDTDANVYLYYENNNTDNAAMTLKFQSSSTHTYFSDELSWNIPYDEIGHKTIANSYFTPYDYSYRAVIYNDSIYGWNITIPLTVRNATKEDEQHYQNLTTNLWFMYADDGKVDYRDDMKVVIHARSNNTTLMNTDVELWKDGIYIACKNLTVTDFTGADFPYYYVWNLVFDYVTGSNYSVRMYGFDRTLLETDYVMCESDNTTRKNKLTIIVKNQNGINVDNAYIYLEEYGSTATGSNYYASFTGLDNGYYRFKATKPDYTGGGWSDITISDNDEIVTYVLSWVGSGSDSTIKQQKIDDTTLKNLYIPLMMLLLILILFGGFKSVI